ncbi:MAG: hypothetical protein HDS29_01890 [Bacteroides sp.]|nr:hypothetical protein [Bacteroides sp.]
MTLNFCKNFLTAFIAISLTVFSSVEADACGWEPTHSPSRYPAFMFVNTPQVTPIDDNVNHETVDFWYDYVGKKVGMSYIRNFMANPGYAIAVGGKSDNPFINYLVEKKDTAAIRFLAESIRFNEARKSYVADSWEYNTPEESRLPEIVDEIRIPSASNPMFERYVFLDIRANAALHRYDKVIELWNRYNGMIKNESLRERMLGYLGGAYYHTHNYVEAISIFSKNGDANSLNWCLAQLVGTDNMTKLFNEDPNSDAVSYVLQDYMNYLWLLKLNKAQEYNFAFPGNPYRNGFYDVDGDLRRECEQLIRIADTAIADKRVEYPAVWATAKAFALNLLEDGAEAKKVITQAAGLKATEAMAQNLKRIDFWIDFSNYREGENSKMLAERYNSLYVNAKSQAPLVANLGYNQFYPYPQYIADYAFLADFIVPYATLMYRDSALYYRALAMMSGVMAMNPAQNYFAFEPSRLATSELHWNGLSAMVEALEHRDRLAPIDKAIFSSGDVDPNAYYDALGRIKLSEGDYDKAIGYFDKLDPYWIGRQGYFVYLQVRYDKPVVPFKRVLRSWLSIDSVSLIDTDNYRADYSRKLQRLKQQYDIADGKDRAIAGYDYAAALFQASAQGDLWAVSDNLWSVDQQVDSLSQRAIQVLQESAKFAEDANMKARIFYAIASIHSSNDAPSYVWARGATDKWDWNTFSPVQLHAYAELAKLYNNIDDARIRSCDILSSYITEKRAN